MGEGVNPMNALRIFVWVGFLAAAVALAQSATAGITIDGTVDSAYGSAIVTQKLGTAFGDSNSGLIDAANGSELDAAYGVVSNGVLYLVLAGNLEANFNHLEIFLQTGPGGQNTLTNVNPNVDYDGLNRMGTDGNGAATGNPGLTFDAAFAPNYYVSLTGGGSPYALYAYYAQLWPGGTNSNGIAINGYALGSTTAGNGVLSGGYNPYGIQATVNNSNTGGVAGDGSGCYVNGAPFGPETVTTGVELAIPLGAIGNPTGPVQVCAFINGLGHDYISNQILGPVWDGTIGYCLGNLGEPSAVNFGSLPGVHSFVVPTVGCNYSINPINAFYKSAGGTGSVGVFVGSGCNWTAANNVGWITITSGASGSGIGTVNYSVATNSTTVGRTGTLTIAGQTFSITQGGGPFGRITADGAADADYGCSLAVQQIGTGFGDSNTGLIDYANGSELDAAYGIIERNVLYLVFAGNLEANFNKLEIFFQTGPGGQNTLTNINPVVDYDGLNRMGADGGSVSNGNPGLTFDANFAPNYWISVAGGGTPYAFYVNYAQLWPGGGGTNGYFLGASHATDGTLFGGTNPFNIQAAINNSNVLGVDGSGCYDDPTSLLQGSVNTGVELAIPLGALGSPTGAVQICAFINNSGHDYVSNQVLGPIWDGKMAFCQGDLGEPTLVNFSASPGAHFFTVGPEMRITSVSTVATNAIIGFITGANSNLIYQVQRTAALTTNTTWSNVGSPTNGTGGIITMTILNGATNRPTQFYRVKETPPCQ